MCWGGAGYDGAPGWQAAMRSTRAPLLEMYRMMGRSGQDCTGVARGKVGAVSARRRCRGGKLLAISMGEKLSRSWGRCIHARSNR